MMINSRRAVVTLTALTALALLFFAPAPARADLFDQVNAISAGAGTDSETYSFIYQGGGGNKLNYNSFFTGGNVGIAGTGVFQGSGGNNGTLGTTIEGALNFSPANNNGGTTSGVTINGGVHFSVSQVQTDMTSLNTLSQNLGAEATGAPTLTIAGNSGVNINTGKLDGNGNYVFSTTVGSFSTGNTFTITGDGVHNVVFDILGSSSFNGNIVLVNINPSQVLFNMYGGNFSTLSGGDTLNIVNNNSNSNTTGNFATGIFLDPNGPISINNSSINGWVYGGDSHDEAVVSGGEADLPTSPPSVPEPSTIVLTVFGAVGFIGYGLRRRRSA